MRSSKVRFNLVAFAIILVLQTQTLATCLPAKATENISRTPSCAMTCILDPHWAKYYAPECSQLPWGPEYGARLCRNFLYRFMIDHCIKGNCDEHDVNTVLQSAKFTS